MTENELNNLGYLIALRTHLVITKIFFDEIPIDELPEEVRDDTAAYKECNKELNEKLRRCVIAKLSLFLTEEK